MKLGVSKDNREDTYDLSPSIRLSTLDPGDYKFRILTGGDRVKTVFYPTVVINEDDGELIQAFRAVRINNASKGGLLERLAKADRKAQLVKGGVKENIRSALDQRTKFVYLVLDRRDTVPEVKVLEVGYKVKTALSTKEKELDEQDATKLKYGLIYMYDVTIKVIDKKKPGLPKYFNRDYAVEFSIKHPFLGKVPVEALDSGLDIENYVKSGIFTEEEWKVISSSSADLKSMFAPESEEDIVQKLMLEPIDVLAVRENKPVFPDPEAIAKVLDKEGIKYCLGFDGVGTLSDLKQSGVMTVDKYSEEEVKHTSEAVVVESEKDAKPTETSIIVFKAKQEMKKVVPEVERPEEKKVESPEKIEGSGVLTEIKSSKEEIRTKLDSIKDKGVKFPKW